MLQRKEAANGQVRAYSENSREHVSQRAVAWIWWVASHPISRGSGFKDTPVHYTLDLKARGKGAEGGYNAREVARQR